MTKYSSCKPGCVAKHDRTEDGFCFTSKEKALNEVRQAQEMILTANSCGDDYSAHKTRLLSAKEEASDEGATDAEIQAEIDWFDGPYCGHCGSGPDEGCESTCVRRS